MDLRSKLGLYKESRPAELKMDTYGNRDRLEGFLSGKVKKTDDGDFFVIENRYPLTWIHGQGCIGEALKIDAATLSMLACSSAKKTEVPAKKREVSAKKLEANDMHPPVNDISVKNLIFLDTETTGLSGGAGTVAFLVGAGFFEENTFVVRQLFMRDYDEEYPMLLELNSMLQNCEGLVTFNGKSFDWNLLLGRFTANRIKPAVREPFHVDLLHPSRNIWGSKLESCRLSSLEEYVLCETRCGDIPGALIPQVYFKFLEDGCTDDLEKVMRHNESDIVSLVSLLVRITSMLEHPFADGICEKELYGVGRIFEKNNCQESMVECLEYCASSESFNIREASVKRLSRVYKREGRYDKALSHWNSLLEASDGFNLFSMLELAMYYEHKEKNIPMAAEIIESLMEKLGMLGITEGKTYTELKKRYERLKAKDKI